MTLFAEVIRNALGGYGPTSVLPGKLVRFPTSDRHGDLSGWARLFDDGDGGAFGCWRTGISEIWQACSPRTEKERKSWAETMRRNRERAERDLSVLRAECREKSKTLWDRAGDVDPHHPYLVAKAIKPYGAKQLNYSLIIPVRGIDGDLRGLQFITESSKKFKLGTEILGGYHRIGKPKDKTLLICEGWATGCTLHSATSHAVAVAFTAGNLLPVCKALRMKYPDWRLIVCSDDDYLTPSNPGLTKATEAAQAIGALLAVPQFPDSRGAKDTDHNDLAQLSGHEGVRNSIEAAAAPVASASPPDEKSVEVEAGGEASESEIPLLFDEIQAPDLSPDLLPGWLGDYVAAVARNTQTPPAMAIMLALSVVATCTAKRFAVFPYGEGYNEPMNLWTATALPPASRKTAVFSAMTSPLVAWEKAETERLAPEVRRVAIQRSALVKRQEKLEKDAANADDPARTESLMREIERLVEIMPEALCPPRLWSGDTTPERLQSLMVEHGERMAVLSDEGGIFEVMAGLYNDGRANLDIFLQAHAGQAVRVDRQGRTAHLNAPALSFGLAIQPAVLADMTCGSKRQFRGKGTLARFLYAVPRSNIGCRDVRATYQVPEDVMERYRSGLFGLLSIPPQIVEGREVPRRLSLSAEALDCWLTFADMVEKRQGDGGDLETLQDWSGKLPGAVLRISGNFHLAEHGGDTPEKIEVSTINKATELCSLLIDHAKAAFSMMDIDPNQADAKALLQWFNGERLSRFSRGEVFRRFKGRFTGKTGRLDKALAELQLRQIITPVTESTRGRPATVFIVNPNLT